jgi:hypothetical protein
MNAFPHPTTSDLGVVDRLALHLQLVSLPGLGLGHHLGDHISAQPHQNHLATASTLPRGLPQWLYARLCQSWSVTERQSRT